MFGIFKTVVLKLNGFLHLQPGEPEPKAKPNDEHPPIMRSLCCTGSAVGDCMLVLG